MRRFISAAGLICLMFSFSFVLFSQDLAVADDPYAPAYEGLDNLLSVFQAGQAKPFILEMDVEYSNAGDAPGKGSISFIRNSDSDFKLSVKHKDADVEISRNPESCAVLNGNNKSLLVGKGEALKGKDAFTIDNIVSRMKALGPKAATYCGLVANMKARAILPTLMLMGIAVVPPENTKLPEGDLVYKISKDGAEMGSLVIDARTKGLKEIRAGFGNMRGTVRPVLKWAAGDTSLHPGKEIKAVEISREEMETTFSRGLRRAAEIMYEKSEPPKQINDKEIVSGDAWYRIIDGQKVVKLKGDARQIGIQHGKLLSADVKKVIESTLYVVGLAYFFEKGRWFQSDLRDATARLDKFTPPEYVEEMKGLAEGSGIPYESIHLANYFPELFHCSGFAIKGKATVDGKLYHGRVLDYMTDIGIQYQSVVFIVEKDGKTPFVNVGYAGFTGSVTGMNAKKICIGEMGGRGEGKLDGIPMAILVRMGLENASNLADVKSIFGKGPRTCEYYYVFSDGKDRSAVGVYAVPEKIEFIAFGEKNPQLPEVIEDCVLMSAGDRYTKLCQLTKADYGKIDARGAMKLMDFPVAMGGANLHNVLFSPEDLKFWVANAGRNGPAYKEKYYEYSFEDLLSYKPVPAVAEGK